MSLRMRSRVCGESDTSTILISTSGRFDPGWGIPEDGRREGENEFVDSEVAIRGTSGSEDDIPA